MGFFGIGTWEILLILVLALIIWGPNKLPEIARKLGNTVRAIRKASYDFTTTITREVEKQEKEQPTQPRKTSSDNSKKSSTDLDRADTTTGNALPAQPERQQQQDEQQ